MQSCKLRPHHGMCIAFFRGKGYDEDFTENMTDIIGMLNREDPYITLTVSEDIICGKCPHNNEHCCDSCDKVSSYDNRALTLCGLSEGDTLPYSEFAGLVQDNILSAGKRSHICGDCCWNGICS
ncbi:MAG: DUF1284 domain-containing protein [Oscillospiraceae bacterium]